MRRTRRFCSAAVAALLVVGAGARADGLTPELLVELARLSAPVLSPDGNHVVYTLRETDRDADRGRTDLWILPLDGSEPAWRLTGDPANDHSAQFSADGRWLYFVSARSGSAQVWRLSLAGGDAQPVTDLPLAVNGFVLAPDGRTLVYSVSVFDECGADFACTAGRLEAERESPASLRRYRRLMIRHWDRWLDGRRNGLFAQPLNRDSGAVTGEAVFLSAGLSADVPSRPFGGMEEVAIAPDSRRVVFAAKAAGREEAWSTDYDLYEVAIGGGRQRNLTDGNPATDTAPLYSADGATLYYLAMSRPGFESDRRRILARPARGGEAREVAPGWDRSPTQLALTAEPGKLYAIADDRGRRRLFEIDAASGAVTRLTAFGWVDAVADTPQGPLIALNSLHKPADLYRIRRPDNALEQLTSVNAERLSATQFGVYEQFSFAGWNNETVYGFVMRPAGAEAGVRYPVAFLIHGGPQGSFADRFHYRWNPQTYAAAGYAVVFIDFHGSTGYGQAFTDSISGDWGGKPLLDLQLGLAAALRRYDFLDGERACALGASYGGFMVNWIAGNWPERFRCLVNHDGVFDQRMMYYTTEELFFPEWEHGGTYHDAPNAHEKFNPVTFVRNWETPMLVIHGALDYRVPETQGIAAFTALQRRGIDSELLHFPTENHWVLSPANSVAWHEAVLEWLARYLK